MTPNHNFIEKHIALATVGQLTNRELEELKTHVSECDSCQKYMAEMAAVSCGLFLTQVRLKARRTPRGMNRRFVQRAIIERIPLKSTSFQLAVIAPPIASFAAMILLGGLFIATSWKAADTSQGAQGTARLLSPAENISERIFAPTEVRHHPAASVKARWTKHKAPAHRRTRQQGPILLSRGNGDHLHSEPMVLPLAPYVLLSSFSNEVMLRSTRQPQKNLDALPRSALYAFLPGAQAATFLERSHKFTDKPSFHLDLTTTSPFGLKSPLNISVNERATSTRFIAPVFPVEPSRNW